MRGEGEREKERGRERRVAGGGGEPQVKTYKDRQGAE